MVHYVSVFGYLLSVFLWPSDVLRYAVLLCVSVLYDVNVLKKDVLSENVAL